MRNTIVSEITAFNLIGQAGLFRKDRLLDAGGGYYYWRQGEPCRVIGCVQRPGDSAALLCEYGKEWGDLEEIDLAEVSAELDLPALRPQTKLATAGRRQLVSRQVPVV